MPEKGTFDEEIYGQFEKLSVQEALQYRTFSDNRKNKQNFEESDEKVIESIDKNEEISPFLFNDNQNPQKLIIESDSTELKKSLEIFKNDDTDEQDASSSFKKKNEEQESVVPEISNEKIENFLENNLQTQFKISPILDVSSKEYLDNSEQTSALQQEHHQEITESLELQDEIKKIAAIPESIEIESHINEESLEKKNAGNSEQTSALQQEHHQEITESLELQDEIKKIAAIPESIEIESHINEESLEKKNAGNSEQTLVLAHKEQNNAVVIQDKKEHEDLLELDFTLDSLAIDGHEHFGDVQLDIPDENYPADTTMIINELQNKIDNDLNNHHFVLSNQQKIKTSSTVLSSVKIINTLPLIVSKHFFPSNEELRTFLDRPFNKDKSKSCDILLKCVAPIASIYECGDNLLSFVVNDNNINNNKANNISEILKLETLNKIDSEEKEVDNISEILKLETLNKIDSEEKEVDNITEILKLETLNKIDSEEKEVDNITEILKLETLNEIDSEEKEVDNISEILKLETLNKIDSEEKEVDNISEILKLETLNKIDSEEKEVDNITEILKLETLNKIDSEEKEVDNISEILKLETLNKIDSEEKEVDNITEILKLETLNKIDSEEKEVDNITEILKLETLNEIDSEEKEVDNISEILKLETLNKIDSEEKEVDNITEILKLETLNKIDSEEKEVDNITEILKLETLNKIDSEEKEVDNISEILKLETLNKIDSEEKEVDNISEILKLETLNEIDSEEKEVDNISEILKLETLNEIDSEEKEVDNISEILKLETLNKIDSEEKEVDNITEILKLETLNKIDSEEKEVDNITEILKLETLNKIDSEEKEVDNISEILKLETLNEIDSEEKEVDNISEILKLETLNKIDSEEKEVDNISEILKLETLNKIDSEEKEETISDQVISETILERLEPVNNDNNSISGNSNYYSDTTAFVSQELLFRELMIFIGFFEEIYSLVPHEEHLNMLDTPGYKAYVSLKGKSETESLRKLMNEMMNDINLSIIDDDKNEEEENNLESLTCLQDYRNKSMKLGQIPFILELSHKNLLSQIVALSVDDVNLEETEQSWNFFLYSFINQDGFVIKRKLNNIIISSRALEITETDYLHLLIQEASDVFGVQPDESLFEPYFRPLDNLAIKEFTKEIEALKLIQ